MKQIFFSKITRLIGMKQKVLAKVVYLIDRNTNIFTEINRRFRSQDKMFGNMARHI